MKAVHLIITGLFLFIFLTGCSSVSKVVEVPVIVEKTQYEKSLVKDTIIIHDSIDRYVSRDTVYLTKIRNVFKYNTKIDSVVKIDSIPVVVTNTITKEVVTNKMNWFQTSFFWLGVICAAYILFKLLKRKL